MQNKEILFDKFTELEQKFVQLEEEMSLPEVAKDASRYQKLAKERAGLLEKVEKFQKFKKVLEEKKRLELLIKEGKEDREFLDLAREEKDQLESKSKAIFAELEESLLDDDPDQDKNIIMEIRAGTGGEEAALFVADLYRMYIKCAAANNFKAEVISSNPTQLGGFKEIIFSIEGKGAYKKFKYESGVHRVQRVPNTEASGRIHTSAVSVAVLPEAEEVDLEINPNDLKIDVYCSTGAGGQSVNTTYSAVRITHLPTGVVVTCQDERSQLKNKAKALKVLRSRLLDEARRQHEAKITQERRTQIGTGDRSEKIRTYNFPDRRVTDHRIGFTLYRIEEVMEGDLEELIAALAGAERQIKLKQIK